MITLVSLLMPSRVSVVRSVVIHAAGKNVFDEVADLKNWKHWHPVFINNSSRITISEPSVGVNALASWSSNGKMNKLLVTEVLANQLKATLMREAENDITNIISVTPVNDSMAVQAEWRVLTKLKWYPWEKFSGIFVDKMTGPGYEAALNNLKDVVENKK
jgi:hypothetical protein